MPLILLLASSALAAQVHWFAPPDPASRDAVQRTLPDALPAEFDTLLPSAAQPPIVARAHDTLAAEYAAARVLVDKFDGELEIMARLSKATSDVRVLRNAADRELLAAALGLQGFAVARYYQDKVATDPGAAPYRRRMGDRQVIAPWADAMVLYGQGDLPPEAVPEANERRAFDETRAYVSAMPRGAIVLGALAEGAEVFVDGVPVESTPGARIGVVPGRHFAAVRVGDAWILAADTVVAPGADLVVDAPYGPREHEALRATIAAGGDLADAPVPAWLSARPAKAAPLYIAVPGRERTRIFALSAAGVSRVPVTPPPAPKRAFSAAISIGGGWGYSNDWFRTHQGPDQAPYELSTFNAGLPVTTLSGRYRSGLFSVSTGLEAAVPIGAWNTWTTGDTEVRPFVFPHLGVGVRYAELTFGPLFPFWMGVGLHGSVPLAGPIEVHAGGVYGIPVSQERADEGPIWTPDPAGYAWLGVGGRVGDHR